MKGPVALETQMFARVAWKRMINVPYDSVDPDSYGDIYHVTHFQPDPSPVIIVRVPCL